MLHVWRLPLGGVDRRVLLWGSICHHVKREASRFIPSEAYMSALPSWIPDLNSPTRLERKGFSETGLNEHDLDKLVIDQAELLADLLLENDLIEGARLRYIGRQFHDVDVLFAEVDEEDEPLRLVLVED